MPELQPNGGFEWTQAARGGALRCRPLLPYADHLFTTRDLHLGRDENEWAAVADAVGAHPSRLRLIRQVHGAEVAVVRQGSDTPWIPPEADVIVSDDPDTAVCVRVADCAPVLLADTRLGVVAAVHAGWRGTVKRAASAAVAAFGDYFGSKPGDLVAAIGPCLGPCCGEVGPEVVEAFRSAGHAQADLRVWFEAGRGDRWLFSLGRANADLLASAGVPPDRIYDAALCTKTHSRLFHSYRADGPAAGRMAAAIRRKKEEGRRKKVEGRR